MISYRSVGRRSFRSAIDLSFGHISHQILNYILCHLVKLLTNSHFKRRIFASAMLMSRLFVMLLRVIDATFRRSDTLLVVMDGLGEQVLAGLILPLGLEVR